MASGHAFAGMAVLFMPVPWVVRVASVTGLGFSLWRCWRHSQVSALILRADGLLDICHADGSEIRTGVLPATTVWPWLIILHMRVQSALVIFPDSLQDADAHRQLRLWLKWQAELNPAAAE